MIGNTVSHYHILDKLGEGGMGVVYKAHDTKLDRTVALKFLPPHMLGNEEEKARFYREARAAAALNHPNITTIYEIDETGDAPSDKQTYIAMEYVDGQTIKDMVNAAPLKLKNAIDTAIQITEALHAAHEKGIIHRDIKSANIMVTESGRVKVMDFGLAKLSSGSVQLTKQGSTLGTISYMSPEQAQGEAVDRRSDLWSLGAVLYEMITGQLPFKGEFDQVVVYSLINEDPEPITALRTGVPMELERIVTKALSKDPAMRYQHADDFGADLKALRQTTPSTSRISKSVRTATAVPQSHATGSKRSYLPIALGVLFVVMVAAGILFGVGSRSNPQSPTVVRLAITAESEDLEFFNFRISPDGSRFVFVAGRGENEQLFVRDLDKYHARPLLNTTGLAITALFFSPDSRWLGFLSRGKMMKVSMSGGTPIAICDAQPEQSASWGEDGSIVFTQEWGGPLWIVSSEGGSTPRPLTNLNVEDGERGHILPQMLPGGTAALFTIWTGGQWDDARIAVADLATGEHRVLFRGGTDARYINSGHIVYMRGSTLMAAPFDLKRLTVTGEALPVLDNIRFEGGGGFARISIADNGTVVYGPGQVEYSPTILTLIDGAGNKREIQSAGKSFGEPLFSPDGNRLLVTIYGATYHIGIYDLRRDVLFPLTFSADNWRAAWLPDGSRVSISSNLDGNYQIYTIPADGGGAPQKIFDQTGNPFPASWSPDGGTLAYVMTGEDTRYDIWIYSPDAEPKNRPFLATRANEFSPSISPDGNWVAYVSDESGPPEVYVQPYPGGSGKWRISNGGGLTPRWSPRGDRIYYRREGVIYSVSVEKVTRSGGMTIDIGREERVMEVERLQGFDLSPDGTTMIVSQLGAGQTYGKLNVILNWFEELDRRAQR
jgi:eukaryotic-like serine/threonine-protein kinase